MFNNVQNWLKKNNLWTSLNRQLPSEHFLTFKQLYLEPDIVHVYSTAIIKTTVVTDEKRSLLRVGDDNDPS